MPSFTFLIASLLFSHFTTTRGHAKTASYPLPGNDLQKHCSFALNGHVYNLCPLVGSTKVVEVAEEMSTENRGLVSDRYALALGGLGGEHGLVKTPGSSCNEETWVCLTSIHKHELRSIPVIQKDKFSNLTLVVDFNDNPDHDPLQLRLLLQGAKEHLDILFSCSEVEELELISDHYGGILRFVWASRHGCPRSSTRRYESKSTLNAWSEGEEPNGSEDPEGNDELLPSDNRKARTGTAFVIAFIVFCIISGSALASSARTRHFVVGHLRNASYALVPVLAEVALKLRPLGQSLNSLKSQAISVAGSRFRQGDDNVERWAQEDMALNSDIMVNGSQGDYPLDEESWPDGSSEYIPLATSPRFGTGGRSSRIQSYGSTPEAAASQERGVMSRMRRYLKI